MSKADLARQAALERVGDAYVYGAWDQPCTVGNRNRYANLNPEYKDAIKNQCPRMKSGKSSCVGCRYEGRRIHDCRGLTNACAKAAGIDSVTGQTVAKQWNADIWEKKGTIDTLPEELPYAQLFRHNGTKWTHTGCYIGCGDTVDARGHSYGVIRKKLSAYGWTHWAVPKGMYDSDTEDETGGDPMPMYWAVVETQSGGLHMRSGPGTNYKILFTLPKGTEVLVIEDCGNGWVKVDEDGEQGYVSKKYLKRKEPESPAPDPPLAGEILPEATDPSGPAEELGVVLGVFIPCDSQEEAMRYAGNIKGAILVRGEKPPGA